MNRFCQGLNHLERTVGLVFLAILFWSSTLAAAPQIPRNPGDGITSDGRVISSSIQPRIVPEADITPNRVIGTDDRSRVTNTTTPPYVGIVYIEGTRCTGFLYKNGTVATAAHCVYDNSAWLNVGAIVPAKNSTSEPRGRCTATNLLASQAWINSRDFNYDFGAIKVNCTGNPTMLLTVASDTFLNRLNVNITGYPASKNSEMWTGSGTITGVFATTVRYNTDTTPGQSGSPVWVRRSDGTGSVYAINSAEFGPPTDNQGVRITQAIYNTLQNY